MTPSGTKERLLQEGEALIRYKGYAAFSYADLAHRVGISKASIHHHFPAKGDLGSALVDGYIERFDGLLAEIERDHANAAERIRAYGHIYAASVRHGMLCLCGVLAAEVTVLPANLQVRVRDFFERQLTWVARVIADGKVAGTLPSGVQSERAAVHILSAFQGAAFVAWAMRKPEIFDDTIGDVVRGLTA